MRNTDVRYKSAWACGLDRLFHRLLRTYTLQYGIRTDVLSQLFDPCYTFATTLSHNVRRAKLAATFCLVSWRLVAIIRSAPICLAESTPRSPTASKCHPCTAMRCAVHPLLKLNQFSWSLSG